MLNCLWEPLFEIDGALEAFASTPEEIRELSLEEIAALLLFADRLSVTLAHLQAQLQRAEEPDKPPAEPRDGVRSSGIIDSMEHPIVQRILLDRHERLNRAARIRRRKIRGVE